MFNNINKIAKLLRFFLIGATYLFVIQPQSSFGVGNLKVGNFEIHPGLDVKETYNSNLFSEADGSGESPDSDFFTTVTPSIDIKYPGENLIFDFGYKVDIEQYSKFTGENTEKHNVAGRLKLISPSRKFALTLENIFKDTRDPSGSDAQSNAALNRADRIQNQARGSIDINVGESLKLVIDGLHEFNEYDLIVLDLENTIEYVVGGALYWKFLPKTSATINLHHKKIDYRDALPFENSDSSSNIVRGGLAFDPTAKLSGEVTVGYEKKDYSNSAFTDGDTFSVAGYLDWQARAKTLININASRSLEESSFIGVGVSPAPGTPTSSFFTRTSVGLGLSQKIGHKIEANVDGNYANNDYPVANRNDDTLSFNAGLIYYIQKWIYLSTKYSYQNNSSNINTRDYKIHELSGNIGAIF